MSRAGASAPTKDRVLVLMPTLRDAERTAQLLAEAGLAPIVCAELTELCRWIRSGADAALVTDEHILGDTNGMLAEAMRAQPAWSMVPVIVVAREGGTETVQRAASTTLTNLTVVERPLRTRTLLSVVLSALRGRRHQYQVRDALRAREEQAAAFQLQGERLQFALSAGGLGSWDLDLDGFVLTCSDLCRQGFGRPAGSAFSYADLVASIHVDDRPRMEAAVHESVMRGAEYDIEYRVAWPNGEEHWLLVRGRAVFDVAGKARRMVGVSLDITDRKRMQEALAEQAEQLRTADRRKDEFLATLAHELRNPLAPIRTGVELLASKPEPALVERTLGVMGRQLTHMVRLVDDLLDVSRITRGKLELKREPVSLLRVVEAAVEATRPAIDHARHRLNVSVEGGSAMLDADFTRLAQVVSNLLHNASKYTPDGGTLWLEAKTEGSEATIVVRDDGIGVAIEDQAGVFEMFSQVKSAYDPSRGGLGIGLALVRSLVELHGGTVNMTSQGAGRGSAFSVRLPLAAAPAEIAAAPPAPSASTELVAARPTVLVVDDNVDAADLLAMVLERAGYETHTAYDGSSALSSVAHVCPAFVILDIGLPDMSGYEVARAIRRAHPEATPRLVALTGWGTSEDKQKAVEAGFDAHLTKPIDAAQLQSVLEEIAQCA